MIVMKFGGTSLADGAGVRRVVELVGARRDEQPVVVVSAHSGITDLLLQEAKAAVRGEHQPDSIRDRHQSIAADLGVEVEGHEELFHDLTDVLRGVSLVAELSPRVLDHIVSFGERFSSRTVAAALTAAGIPAQALMAYDAGLTTDSRFGRATPLPESDAKIKKTFEEPGPIRVITGFLAKDRAGNITTVGRNGSDYTAALFARALGADEIQIWTDVPGVMTADPRIVPDAHPLEAIGFDEAAELAYYGAAVLHPATLVPAVQANIPVRVLDTRKPEEKGTVICRRERERETDSVVRAIVHKSHICLLNIVTPRMLGHHGFMAKVFQACARHEIALDMIATTEVSVSATTEHGQDLDGLVDDLRSIAEVSIDRGVATIAVVGHGIGQSGSAVETIFSTLEKANIPPRMISMGARRTNVGLVVDREHTRDCVRALHKAFFREDARVIGT